MKLVVLVILFRVTNFVVGSTKSIENIWDNLHQGKEGTSLDSSLQFELNAACSKVPHRELCLSSIVPHRHLLQGQTYLTRRLQYSLLMVKAAQGSLGAMRLHSTNLRASALAGGLHKMALIAQDCVSQLDDALDMLGDTVEELEQTSSGLPSVDGLSIWVTGANTLASDCSEGLSSAISSVSLRAKDAANKLQAEFSSATRLVSNCLSSVSGLHELAVSLNSGLHRRKILQDHRTLNRHNSEESALKFKSASFKFEDSHDVPSWVDLSFISQLKAMQKQQQVQSSTKCTTAKKKIVHGRHLLQENSPQQASPSDSSSSSRVSKFYEYFTRLERRIQENWHHLEVEQGDSLDTNAHETYSNHLHKMIVLQKEKQEKLQQLHHPPAKLGPVSRPSTHPPQATTQNFLPNKFFPHPPPLRVQPSKSPPPSPTTAARPSPRQVLSSAPAKSTSLAPDAVVAKDGSGQYQTVQAAVDAAPVSSKKPYIIFIKKGKYVESVQVQKKYITLVGEGPSKTIISFNKSVATGATTFTSATLNVRKKCFTAVGLRVENTAGANGSQAVALHLTGDMHALYQVDIAGYQDSLYVHTGRQYYRNSSISGVVDFIFGNAFAVLHGCDILLLPGSGTIAASSRKSALEPTGIVFYKSRIFSNPTKGTAQSYLGRPWHAYARTIYMNCTLGQEIMPQGWLPWNGETWGGKPFYAEYGNTGLGAKGNRTTWAKPGVLNPSDIPNFLPSSPLLAASNWISTTSVPYNPM
eukprot:TRINITY_DN3128_c0_g1_i1.p1 TRINITY_DN3128_c0_g1~~TRINITY_DN3128_c0_g1_i1.p1  ORF type:complete len:752 (+),score=83.44 TRINITY_DN3128_c0_g1_i1:103-2358(+)